MDDYFEEKGIQGQQPLPSNCFRSNLQFQNYISSTTNASEAPSRRKIPIFNSNCFRNQFQL